MSNEIIDFYKAAIKEKDTDEQKPLVTESTAISSVKINEQIENDPFGKFLFELAEKLQNEKVITKRQQETFVEQIKQPVVETTNETDDPFQKFIGSFANILKQDQLVNREENIKEATIDFINKLKEEPEELPEPPKVKIKQKKYLPPTIAKKVQKLPQVPVREEDTVTIKQPEKEENKYVKELKTADKNNKKTSEKIKSLSDIKSIVEKQVTDILSRYPNLGFTGGGGGTNAVQYAKGGTMDGDLNVTGKFLSGGVDLASIFSGGGGESADRLVSGSESLVLKPNGSIEFPDDTIKPPNETILTLESENPALSSFTRVALSPYAFFAYDNEGNSITFDEVDNAIVLTSQDEHEWVFNKKGELIGPNGKLTVNSLSSLGQILSSGIPLHDIFLTAETDSQTLTYNQSAEILSISNGNTVSLSSLNDKGYINTNFARLSGGIITGDLTIQGNISALGTSTFANTIFTTTSALSVYNTGPGPALYVYQATGPYDVASFYDGDGIEVLHVGNSNIGGLGRVGVNVSSPNKELTVQGSISATDTIHSNVYLSGGVNLTDIFLTSESDSQTLTLTESSAQLTISNGNTVSLSSLQNNYIYTNTSQNVLANRKYAFDTSNSSLTATLPASPQIGDEIEFFDITGYWFINNLVIVNNGNYIEQKLETLECDVKFGCIQLLYVGPIDNIGWRIIPKPRHSVPSIITPVISISSDISLGYDPITINFTGVNNLDNTVAPVNNWYWNLTGGNTPDYFTQNVSYTYSTPGVYTINLTGSNAVGIGTTSKTITALPILTPIPTISSNLVTLSGLIPLTASFVGLNTLPVSSSPVSNWYWNLTGGNTADYTTQTVTYVYETSGNYTVNLSASNVSGTGTTSVIVTASPILGDPYFSNVSLLMNMDSNFSDQSLNNYSFTQFGTPSINTSIKKFGSGSGYFDSSGDYLTSSASSLFGFGTGDFTIEAWIYPTGTSSFQGLFCVGDYITGILIRWHADAVTDSCYINSTVYNWFPAVNAPRNTWTHIALVRQSGNIKFFAGGIDRLVGSPVNNSNLGTTGVPLIGASSHSTSEGFNGYIDELRVTKGIARYTSTFTPPDAPFKNF